MADRKSRKPRARDAAQNADQAIAVAARALADATARVSDQSGQLVGEDSDHASSEDAAHWIAVYTELLSFKAELLEITSRRRLSMSPDARGEAEADAVVIGAQADKYTRRLQKWRSHVDASLAGGPVSHVLSLFVEGRPRLFGHLLIDPWKRTVVNGSEPQQLTPTEWQLLRTFLEHPGEVLSRAQLATAVWADEFDSAFGKVEVSVSRLRRKLEAVDGKTTLIETVRGNGYRLVLPLEAGHGAAASHGDAPPPSPPRRRPRPGR
jgi:DNA-binding winged helix-turn-helix (wHTH) protein